MKSSWWLGLGLLASGAAIGCALSSRSAYESPRYTVALRDGRFELRHYPELHVARTDMAATAEDDAAFMRLFRFIDKGNERNQKIAMTTPVLMDRGASGSMSFILPRKTAAEGAPVPQNDRIERATVPAGAFVSLRFSNPSEAGIREAIASVESWAHERAITLQDDPIVAFYDPPWTPSFLRRNEILWRTRA